MVWPRKSKHPSPNTCTRRRTSKIQKRRVAPRLPSPPCSPLQRSTLAATNSHLPSPPPRPPTSTTIPTDERKRLPRSYPRGHRDFEGLVQRSLRLFQANSNLHAGGDVRGARHPHRVAVDHNVELPTRRNTRGDCRHVHLPGAGGAGGDIAGRGVHSNV